MVIIISLLKDRYDNKYVGLRLFDLASNKIKCVQIDDVLDKVFVGNNSIYGLHKTIDSAFMAYYKDGSYIFSIDDVDIKKLDKELTYKEIIDRLKYYIDTEEVIITNYNNSKHVKYVCDGEKLAYRIANYKDGALLYSYEVRSILFRTEDDIAEMARNIDIYGVIGYGRDKALTPILDNENLNDNEVNTLNKLVSNRNTLYQNIGIEKTFGTNNESVTYIGDDILVLLGNLDEKYNIPTNIRTLSLRGKSYGDIDTSIRFKPYIENIIYIGQYIDTGSFALNIIKSESFNIKYIGSHTIINTSGCIHFDNDVYCDYIEIDTEAFYMSKGIRSEFNIKFNVNRIHEMAFIRSDIIAKNFELYSDNKTGIIEEMAFSYADIETLTLGNGLKIADSAFYNCHIGKLIINGDIEVLNGNIFRYCSIGNLSIGDDCNKLYGNLFNEKDCTITNIAYIKNNGNLTVYGAGTPINVLEQLIGMSNVILGDNSCENFYYNKGDKLIIKANLNGTDIFKGSKIDWQESVIVENISKAVGCFRNASINTNILRISSLYESMFEGCRLNNLHRLDLPAILSYIPCRAFYKAEISRFGTSILEWLSNNLASDSVIDKEAFAYVSEHDSYESFGNIEIACDQIGISAFEGAIVWENGSELLINSNRILNSAFKKCAFTGDFRYRKTAYRRVDVHSSYIEKEALSFKGTKITIVLNEDATLIDKDCMSGSDYILDDFGLYVANRKPLQNADVDLVVKKYFYK